jgi:large repetitive protein
LKKIVTILLIALPLLGTAQKQGNIWYFQGNGLDFNSGTPVLLTNGQIPSGLGIEGTATISDSTGNLLFYATAQTIWNKNHQIMSNGSGLLGGVSTSQGVFIIPIPNYDSLFYVFTLDEMQNCFQNGLRYSIVNMCLDNSLGAVDNLHKNILLLDSAGEKMAATFHSNGNNIWLVVHKYFSDAFYSYLITMNGISNAVISHVGSYHPADSTTNCYQAIGQMKISPDGSKLAVVNGNAFTHSIKELFDFNNTTGVVSNTINLQPDSTFQYYGVSFSPDNSKLYLTKYSNSNQIYQYDLISGVPSTIIASKTVIHTSNNALAGLQLGPDGKIYIVVQGANYIDIISNPNVQGISCNYIFQGINIINPMQYSFDNFIDSYNYKNGVPNCKLTGINELSFTNVIISSNPLSNNLTIETQCQTEIEILNLQGQILKRLKITDNKKNIDISDFASGVYIIRAQTDKSITIKKFIKE